MGHLQPDPTVSQDERGKRLKPEAFTFTDLASLHAAGFDDIIDVRSPAEFAEDRVPGAISLPVLSDAERAEVGTIYTQDSPFKARKLGAALVAKNAAHHLQTVLADKPGDWRPLVYCWRGGQRSGSFATILAQIGWRVQVLSGGYRSWRRHVVGQLYDRDLPFRIVRLDGLTGTGKTALLARVAALGGQVIDLEGLACHRGSILGDIDGGQPQQKGFETALVAAMEALDPARPVLVEAESARIGALRLPPALWAAMRGSKRVVVEAPVAARAAFLAQGYADLTAEQARLAEKLTGLTSLAGHATVRAWQTLLKDGDHLGLAQSLVEQHYDPAYRRARKGDESPVLTPLTMPDLSDTALDQTAARIVEALSAA